MYGNKMGMKCMGMGNEREMFCSTYVDTHERIHTGQKPVNLMEMSGIFHLCLSHSKTHKTTRWTEII